jgi:hypothetical protein
MIKKIEDPICWKEAMTVAWAMLFVYYSDHEQFANDLMQAVQMITKMRDQEFDKLLNYYILLQDNIDKAGKAEQQNISRSSQHQENDMSTLPLTEEIMWRDQKTRNVSYLKDMVQHFWTFVDECLQCARGQVAGSFKTLWKSIWCSIFGLLCMIVCKVPEV